MVKIRRMRHYALVAAFLCVLTPVIAWAYIDFPVSAADLAAFKATDLWESNSDCSDLLDQLDMESKTPPFPTRYTREEHADSLASALIDDAGPCLKAVRKYTKNPAPARLPLHALQYACLRERKYPDRFSDEEAAYCREAH